MNTEKTKPNLNLARKLRSKQFDQIIGQELSVRMLKNSLYLNQFFPVYLFSGQRGCGKTTTARVFATALNCERLSEFQKDPRSVNMPCLECSSCTAMSAGNHPDFIEIDAASHTGVDNVRTIIEAASLLPVMGNKKIYLIDEAHMLSKAAFNAFLKLLEEPPPSVIFMLATTDPQKIIETVRSRCFQIFFTAIDSVTLVDYLIKVCKQEAIKIEKDALISIVKETEGSARDALNLLEQVRFASGIVTKEAVEKVLGRMSESTLLTIFESLITKDIQKLLLFLQDIKFESFSPLIVWQSFQELVRSALFTKYGAGISQAIQDKKRFQSIVTTATTGQLSFYLQKLYDYELILLKTTVQHGMLEMLFLELSGYGKNDQQKISMLQEKEIINFEKKEPLPLVEKVESTTPEKKTSLVISNKTEEVKDGNRRSQWDSFMNEVLQMSDPMLVSIFKQAKFDSFEEEKKELRIIFTQASGLFDDWLNDTKEIWMKKVTDIFGQNITVVPIFQTGPMVRGVTPKKSASATINVRKDEPVTVTQKQPSVAMPNRIVSPGAQQRASIVNVSDKDKWKTANQLLDAFGGVVIEDVKNEKV